MESRLANRFAEIFASRFAELEGRLAVSEARLMESMRDMHLPAQEQARARDAALEARAVALESRAATMEGRLAEIEKKFFLNPPAA